MGTRPDLQNTDQNVAVWLSETDDGNVKLNIHKDGEYIGTVVDFHNHLGFATSWYVYIIECEPEELNFDEYDTKYYTGQTWNIKKRWKEHVNKIGSKYMRKNNLRPLKMVYLEGCKSRSESLQREKEIKNWSHDKKKRKANKFIKNNYSVVKNFSLQHDSS